MDRNDGRSMEIARARARCGAFARNAPRESRGEKQAPRVHPVWRHPAFLATRLQRADKSREMQSAEEPRRSPYPRRRNPKMRFRCVKYPRGEEFAIVGSEYSRGGGYIWNRGRVAARRH